MENKDLVTQMVNWLNLQDLNENRALGINNGGWVAQEGYFAVTKFEYGSPGKAVFTPTFGVPLKVFTNLRTGEVKHFLASKFEVQ